MERQAAAAREALIEMVAEADETLMEHFFEAGTLTQEELVSGLKKATARGKLFPLVCASGLAERRRRSRCSTRIARLPAVAGRAPVHRPWPAARRVTRTADESAPYAAFVWKTVADQFAGRITLFRVYQGALKSDSTVHQRHARHARNGSATWW